MSTCSIIHWVYASSIAPSMNHLLDKMAPDILAQFGASQFIGGPAARSGVEVKNALLREFYGLHMDSRDVETELNRYLAQVAPNNRKLH